MRTPEEAVSEILEHTAGPGEAEDCVLAEAAGRVLASDVEADRDLPPFEKSAMDGYAVQRADFSGASASEVALRLVGESSAGSPHEGALKAGECIAIYTGAVVPDDCDAVVMVERTRREGDTVWMTDDPRPRQHICARGEDVRRGQRVLAGGRRLGPADLSVLASVGCEPVPVFPRPRVSILTTGDELVSPAEVPGPGQIREGNTLHLAALARAAGAVVLRAEVLRDDPEHLARSFELALADSDFLISTGGVSMGRYDLVGDALRACGVERVFHKVAIKPGKPVWFGVREEVAVFGLPGNPVSCLVGHEVFVRPALAKRAGAVAEQAEGLRLGRWDGDSPRTGDRQQNIPVAVTLGEDGVDLLRPVPWRSSADVVGLARAAGLAVLEPGETLEPGDLCPYRPLD
jgi:molybdopterin molybdotransferase